MINKEQVHFQYLTELFGTNKLSYDPLIQNCTVQLDLRRYHASPFGPSPFGPFNWARPIWALQFGPSRLGPSCLGPWLLVTLHSVSISEHLT